MLIDLEEGAKRTDITKDLYISNAKNVYLESRKSTEDLETLLEDLRVCVPIIFEYMKTQTFTINYYLLLYHMIINFSLFISHFDLWLE